MKLTRKLLRKLIIEAIIDEADTKRYISSPDGDVTPADLAALTAQGKDILAADVHPSIATLVQSDDIESRVQGRELADAFGDINMLTPEEATAIDILGYEKSFEEDEGLKPAIDKAALYGAMKSKSKGTLKHFGFMYVEDAPHLVPETDYEDMGDMFRFQARALGCDEVSLDPKFLPKVLAWVDSEYSYATQLAIYDMVRVMKPTEIPIPDDDGYHGNNKLYDLGGFKVLFTGHMGGYYTITICGKDAKDVRQETMLDDPLMESSMFDPRAARARAKFRAKTSIPGDKMGKLSDMLDSEDEETAIQGHSMLDALGDYDSPTGAGSYQDIEDFDQQMDDAMASQRKMQALDDWEKYMAAAGPEVSSVVNKLTQPGVDLYVVSLDDDRRIYNTPGEEVVRRPENFHLMAISSPTGGFSFADDIGALMGIDFEGDDMDAILIFLEQLAGDNNIGYVPTGYKFSPEDAFMAWITENNPSLRIFVDP